MKEKTVPDVTALWQESRLRITDVFHTPPVILRVGDSAICTLGNFSASTGKAKSKKTFNVCALTASALKNGTVLEYRAEMPSGKRKILYVDTEQSPFHCQRVLSRIIRLAELSVYEQPENLEFLLLRRFATKTRLAVIETAIYQTDNLGLVIIDGARDLVYDINSPGESAELISKLMQWTDERQIHIHTVLHVNKGDGNTRGHLGTELNNKAETVLQVKKDETDGALSSVSAMCIRDVDFSPFAFRINSEELPELVEDYRHPEAVSSVTFDYQELSEAQHREALEKLFSTAEPISYSLLIEKLRESYLAFGHDFGFNKAKSLKTFLENKRMILKEGRRYRYNPDFYY